MSSLRTLAPAHALHAPVDTLVCHDPESCALLRRIEQVGPSDATVLILGETGTGKELLARRLHRESGRQGPFVAVNCGAFGDSLVDAELFGHESGAFTGAHQARAGWFEAADHGTLFLDEVGDMPLHLQVKLLRVLQERQVVRLGSRRPVNLDFRLVVATNVDLWTAVCAQRFRADLYYRLSVVPLTVRPLRDRPDDILPLAQHFLAHYAHRLGRPRPVLGSDAQAALRAYPWPGNIRELENLMHFAVITAPDSTLHAHDLHGLNCHPAGPVPSALATGPARDGSPSTLDSALSAELRRGSTSVLRDVEAALVRQAWASSGHNQVHTAQYLGITRNALRTLLKRHGLIAPAPTQSA